MADFRISDNLPDGVRFDETGASYYAPMIDLCAVFKQRYNRAIDHNPWSEEEACESY